MTIIEANKIATHSESKWRVIDRTNEIVEIEVTYRKKWLTLIAEIVEDWNYSSNDPEEHGMDYHSYIKEVLAVKFPNDELGEDVILETTEEDLQIINKFYYDKLID